MIPRRRKERKRRKEEEQEEEWAAASFLLKSDHMYPSNPYLQRTMVGWEI